MFFVHRTICTYLLRGEVIISLLEIVLAVYLVKFSRAK